MFVLAVQTNALEGLEEQLVALARGLERQLAHWLHLVGEYDALGGAERWGFVTTADWLAFGCAITPRTAREHVRVARRLRERPQLHAAFARGEVSYSKIRALTRARDCEREADLLHLAGRCTAAELERRVGQLRSAPAADADVATEVHEQRDVQWWTGRDGALHLRGRLPADDGAQLVEAIQVAAQALHGAGVYAGAATPPRRGARYADALCELALSGAPRAQVVVHVDPPALACTATDPEERAGTVSHLDDGPAIGSEVARRLACDAELVDPDLGRRRRVVSAALRTALERRDACCTFPGCTRRHGLHAHHVRHWAHGGATDKANLTLVCPYHHRLVHEGGFGIRLQDGAPTFLRPDRRAVTQTAWE